MKRCERHTQSEPHLHFLREGPAVPRGAAVLIALAEPLAAAPLAGSRTRAPRNVSRKRAPGSEIKAQQGCTKQHVFLPEISFPKTSTWR